MAGYRQLHTRMWSSDQWFADLTPERKLQFIYLFSNERASVCGLYELPMRVICFETGLDRGTVEAGYAEFAQAGKVEYDPQSQVVWVKNMLKYQGTESPQVRKRIIADVKAVPDCEIKNRFIGIHRVLIGYADGSETLHSISSLSLVESSEVEGGGAGEGTYRIPETVQDAYADPFIAIYKQVSGCFPGQRNYADVVGTIQLLQAKHGDGLIEYLSPFWTAWSSRKTKDGKPYSKLSLVWLCEWAMQGEVPRTNGHEPQRNWSPVPDVDATRKMLEERDRQFEKAVPIQAITDSIKDIADRKSVKRGRA